LEEEDEDAKYARVDDDVARLRQALSTSGLSSGARKEASENLKHIAIDVAAIRRASPEHSAMLKEAVHDRIQAFRLMVQSNKPQQRELYAEPELEDDEAGAKFAAVDNDVAALEREVKVSNLPAKLQQAALDDLHHISADVNKLKSANHEVATKLKEAIHDRVQAFKLMVAESKPASHSKSNFYEFEEEEDVEVKKTKQAARVKSDVKNLEELVAKSSLSASAKVSARNNLEAIKKDTELFRAAKTEQTRDRYKQAINKRVEALGLELKQKH